jgi:hypothetical protein
MIFAERVKDQEAEAVKRNKDRFPEDFMFQLTHQEGKSWWTEVMDRRLRS